MTLIDDPAAAFEALYRRHYGAVLRYARRRMDAAGAEEVVAETFMVAWQRLDDVPETPLPWLLAVARNTLSNRYRALDRAREKGREAQAGATLFARDPADALAERDEVIRRSPH